MSRFYVRRDKDDLDLWSSPAQDQVMEQKVALVVGANGVIGSNLIDYLSTLDDWRIVGVSRRGGVDTDKVTYLAVDLLDPADTQAKLGGRTEITHVFYAAYQDRPTWAELVSPTWRCWPTSSTRSTRSPGTSASCRATRSTARTSARSRPRPARTTPATRRRSSTAPSRSCWNGGPGRGRGRPSGRPWWPGSRSAT